MKSLYETLAVLGAGAVLLTGCGGAPAPVNAAEVPAAADAKPASPTEGNTGDAAAAAVVDGAKPAADAAPAPAAAGAAAPAAASSAKPAAAPAAAKKTGKKVDAKKTGANGKCGEGTCG